MSLHHLQSLLNFEADSGSASNNGMSEKGVCKHWRLDVRFCTVIAETCVTLVFAYIMTLWCDVIQWQWVSGYHCFKGS